MRLTLERRDDGWWIKDAQDELPDHGPYETRQSADEDRIGLEKFLTKENK